MKLISSFHAAAHLVSRTAHLATPQMAYVGGWRGQDNLGDEALLAALAKMFPAFRLVPVRGYRHEKVAGRILPPFRAGLLAGGTLINRSGSIRSAENYSSRLKTFIVFGTGAANPAFWAGRHIDRTQWIANMARWKAVLDRCAYVGVRGPLSAKTLIQSGAENVEVIGDPVLCLADDSREDNHHENCLGLNIGVSDGRIWGTEQRLVKQMGTLATLARQAGWTVKWFVVWPGDLAPTIAAAMQSRTAQHIHHIYRNHVDYMKLAGETAVFVGVKLHAVALATCAFVPSIMIEYRPKCRDYMAAIGQENLTVRSDRFSAFELWARVVAIAKHRSEYRAALRSRILRLRDRQIARAKELSERICE